MASRATAVTAFLLCLNLLFFSMVSACGSCYQPPKIPHYPPKQPAMPSCPRDTLKLGVCANLLGNLLNLVVGTPPKTPCCPLLQGLADLEAAVCLCTALKANILGIHLNIPLSLSLLLNYCGNGVPHGFQCA